MGLVDLHVHTTYSDGRDTPSEVVKMAVERGVAVLAVTDHDNLGGLDEAVAAGREQGLSVILGVEISARFHGRRCHILGYGFDAENDDITNILKKNYSFRKERVFARINVMNERLAKRGEKLIDIEDLAQSNGPYFNTNKTARYLAAKGFASDAASAKQDLAAVPAVETPFSAAEVIAAIHASRGIAIVAHPFSPRTSLKSIDPTREGQEKLLLELKAAGVDGLECYQSGYQKEDIGFALEMAARHGLFVSGGSDWHGAIHDVGEGIRTYIPFYPDHIGALGVTTDMVAPLLERLGVPRT